MAPTCGSGRRAQHKDSGLRRLVCPGESCPPALALKPDRRLLPTRPWWLLSCCPCTGARAPSLRRRVRWPFKRNAWDSPASVPQPPSPLAFTARREGTCLPGLEPWAGTSWGLGPLLLRGLHSQDSPADFYPPHVGRDQPGPCLSPPTISTWLLLRVLGGRTAARRGVRRLDGGSVAQLSF